MLQIKNRYEKSKAWKKRSRHLLGNPKGNVGFDSDQIVGGKELPHWHSVSGWTFGEQGWLQDFAREGHWHAFREEHIFDRLAIDFCAALKIFFSEAWHQLKPVTCLNPRRNRSKTDLWEVLNLKLNSVTHICLFCEKNFYFHWFWSLRKFRLRIVVIFLREFLPKKWGCFSSKTTDFYMKQSLSVFNTSASILWLESERCIKN